MRSNLASMYVCPLAYLKNPQLHCFRNIPERTAYKLTKQVCVELSPLALNVTLPAFAVERRRLPHSTPAARLSPARRAIRSKTAGHRCCCPLASELISESGYMATVA